MSYYHYTKGCHLPSIVKDGFIKTSAVLLDKHERPAVWLTKSPEWDIACNVGIVTNAKELISGQIQYIHEVNMVTSTIDYMKGKIGMCRILVNENIPTITWAKYKYVSGISEKLYNGLDRRSRSEGSPVDKWICTFNPIPRKFWEGIEMYVDNVWVKWDEKFRIEEFVELCLSCNGKRIIKDDKTKRLNNDSNKHKVDFINKYKESLIRFWEENKHKSGYIEVCVKPDYTLYDWDFTFIETRINKSSFKAVWKSRTNKYALVHFIWEATHTQHKLALAYELGRTTEFE